MGRVRCRHQLLRCNFSSNNRWLNLVLGYELQFCSMPITVVMCRCNGYFLTAYPSIPGSPRAPGLEINSAISMQVRSAAHDEIIGFTRLQRAGHPRQIIGLFKIDRIFALSILHASRQLKCRQLACVIAEGVWHWAVAQPATVGGRCSNHPASQPSLGQRLQRQN